MSVGSNYLLPIPKIAVFHSLLRASISLLVCLSFLVALEDSIIIVETITYKEMSFEHHLGWLITS